MRALLPHTPGGAQVDAEDVGQVHPFHMNDAFMILLWQNVLAVIHNFWRAGYHTVIAGSFVANRAELARFRARLEIEHALYVIHLCASKPARDRRRILRAKPSTREWRERVDAAYPEDTSFAAGHGEYRYVRIDNTALSLEQTVDLIKHAIPEIYGSGVEAPHVSNPGDLSDTSN